MNKFFCKLKTNFLENKAIYLVSIFLLMILIFTHFNTFVTNDDLPYSFLYRGSNRITNIFQAFKNQIADYQNLNGRFFVHSILQIVLIFGKNLWSIINPIMIVTTLIILIKIVKLKNKNVNNLISILLVSILFLLIFSYKPIIYWVAGSVNYIWVLTLLFILLYLYYKYGFFKYKIVNILLIAFLCALHECTMIFTIVFIIGNFLVTWFKNKKIDKSYLLYFLGFLGSLFLFLSPASNIRLNSDAVWSNLTLFDKLLTAIPVVSKNLFNLTDIGNILPYAFIIAIIVSLYKIKNKIANVSIILIILNMIAIYVFNNNWLYFLLVLLLVFGEYYSHFKKNRLDLIILSLAMYAVIFSNILTPLYYAARPNYYFYIYMIFYVLYVVSFIKISFSKLKVIVYIFLIVLFIELSLNEVIVYNTIGKYYKKRLNEIQQYKINESNEPLVLSEIPNKYRYYHIDINEPTESWFTYKYFLDYYGLPEDTEIIYR